MNIIFKNYIDQLDIEKVKNIRFIEYKDYNKDVKFSFTSGGVEIYTCQGDKKDFDSIQEFYVYVDMMRYLNYIEFKIPTNIRSKELSFEYLDKQKFEYYMGGYFDTFKDFSGDQFWKCTIDTKGFMTGYKLKNYHLGLILIGEFEKHYFAFYFHNID